MNPSESLLDTFKTIKNASKPFGVNYTTLDIIKSELDARKLTKVSGSIVKFAREYNKTLDLIYEACEVQSKANNDTGKLHLMFVRNYFEIAIKGINQNQTS